MKMDEGNIKDRSVCVDVRNTATRDVTKTNNNDTFRYLTLGLGHIRPFTVIPV